MTLEAIIVVAVALAVAIAVLRKRGEIPFPVALGFATLAALAQFHG